MVGVDETAGARPNPRLAIVASSQVIYGMARMYQLLTGGSTREVGVFEEMDAAIEWLGLADPSTGAPATGPRPPE